MTDCAEVLLEPDHPCHGPVAHGDARRRPARRSVYIWCKVKAQRFK